MKSFRTGVLCFLFVFLSANVPMAQSRTSPFSPPEASDTIFIVDDSPGLDTGCTFREGGPLVFDIYVTRFVGAVNPDGTLKNSDMLVTNKVVPESAIMAFPAFDVDYDISDRPSLITEGIKPERDRIKFNGVEINRVGAIEPYLMREE